MDYNTNSCPMHMYSQPYPRSATDLTTGTRQRVLARAYLSSLRLTSTGVGFRRTGVGFRWTVVGFWVDSCRISMELGTDYQRVSTNVNIVLTHFKRIERSEIPLVP